MLTFQFANEVFDFDRDNNGHAGSRIGCVRAASKRLTKMCRTSFVDRNQVEVVHVFR